MKNNENNRNIIITLDNGEKKQGVILFTFEANGDNYVLYELDKNAHAAKIDKFDQLIPIDEDEWKLVEKTYNEYMEVMDLNQKKNKNG